MVDASLQAYPIPGDVRARVVDELWRPCQPQTEILAHMVGRPDLNTYVARYYSHQCLRFARDGGIHISVKTHSEVIKLAHIILQGSTRAMIVCELDGKFKHNPNENEAEEDLDEGLDEKLKLNPAVASVQTAINLCAGLVTMCNFGDPECGFSSREHLPWSNHQTLRQAIAQHFQREKKLQPDNPRMRRLFTARHLVSIGGLKIRWTNNLMDHLRLSDDDRAVFIFHNAEFLRYQSCLSDQIFPDDLISETLRTLTLLFPQNDRKTRRWLSKQISEHSLDPSISRCGNAWAQDRRFENFYFWHDRLVILKQNFDDASPRKLSQWWGDRRNSAQWYTFWVAILVFVTTVFFGLVQSIEGALQVYLSWKSLQQEGGPDG
ncbi:hypothetical protein QBC34DRAFT_381068 [Podospora aff. communis PSN243]|uniref:Uncharacterized protein n=1 Tax=Podospora aff. communis PSN243 TaxID=3040156 RepID=A0AAV9GJV6_9PEZI|nr:hypothetical protein QBC34DRAFT_381068 [Podospora aff. communis PSN243]